MEHFMQSQRLRPEDIINASDVAGFDMGALDMSEDWIKWISKYCPIDVSSLPVEMIPFIPSPTTVDCPLLGTTADFIDNDLNVPLAFQGGEDGHAGLEKLFELDCVLRQSHGCSVGDRKLERPS